MLIVAIGIATGWSHASTQQDKPPLVVHPGRGVPGICEIGMSFAELAKTNQLQIHGPYKENGPQYIVIPSLGAHLMIEHADPVVKSITFHTTAYQNPPPLDMRIDTPFRGIVAPGVSFAHGAVDVVAIMKALGPPADTWVLPPFPTPEDYPTPAYIGYVHAAGSWRYKSSNWDMLFYFHRGIKFDIKSNTVVSFSVSVPFGKRNQREGTNTQERATHR